MQTFNYVHALFGIKNNLVSYDFIDTYKYLRHAFKWTIIQARRRQGKKILIQYILRRVLGMIVHYIVSESQKIFKGTFFGIQETAKAK